MLVVVLSACGQIGYPSNGGSEAVGKASGQRLSSSDALSVTFMDVGQGSSALIQLPDEENVLIDGGPREGGPQRVADLQKLGVEKLDAVVVTHADEDHAGGLVDVLGAVKTGILKPDSRIRLCTSVCGVM
ncbi:MAG: MBL fold metallo-hydrolase [Rubrobacter sp.]|nr:MBL fold metallo-hydrolase [Rubrobacter sp.]